MVKIIADSTCDLSPELIEKYEVDILPLHILLGDKEYEDGRREGIQLGEEKAIQNLMHTMNISDREARKLLGFDKTAKKNEGI